MLSLLLSTVAFVAALPAEYVVDCSSWPGENGAVGKYAGSFRYECRNGDVITSNVGGDFGVSAAAMVDCYTIYLRDNQWQYQPLGKPGEETAFVIRGSKTSPIKSVTFKGDGWTPTVQRRIVLPPPKK